MADAHQDASLHDEGRSRETKFFGTEQRSYNNISAGLHLSVNLNRDAVAKIVRHQCLLSFGKTELPRSASVLKRVQRRCAGATVVA